MKSYSIHDYQLAGCQEMHGAMVVVHMATQGKVCDTGCWAFKDGQCPAYKKLTAPLSTKIMQTFNADTVREEAERRKISISEVRRQRRVK